MSKRIMFIGAGPHQLKGIEKAKAMGLYVIATDGNGEAPGLGAADEGRALDVKDIQEHLRLARERRIDGVVAIASEASLKTVAAVCEDLGLPGLRPPVIEIATDKHLMRRAWRRHGLPTPKSKAVYSQSEAGETAKEFGYPVVVKPADSAGSRGVRLVEEIAGISSAYAAARAFSTSGKVLVEEFMEGPEASVEAFVYEGVIHILALSDKLRTQPPYLLDIDVIFPSAVSGSLRERVIEVTKQAIAAIGIDIGPVHAEVMLTPNGPVPVELGARGPGFKVFTDIIPMVTGVDTLKATIDAALGQKPDLRPTKSMAAAIRFLDAPAGTVREVAGVKEAGRAPGAYEAEIYVKPGDITHALTSGADRVGHVISYARTRDEACRAVELMAKEIVVKVERQPDQAAPAL